MAKEQVPGKKPKTAAPPMLPKKYINVYLCLGSNIGDRRAVLNEAKALIIKNIGKVARQSHLYETEPWGKPEQDTFLNQVIMINTTLDPRGLLEEITKIERDLGRERKEKWGPRVIDVDILFYGRRVIRDKGLEVPHPELHKRAFVLAPLLEIAPELEHPILKKPIDELYMACTDESDVVQLES
jgi:2-amino-4-hydroxy-6-hydroxymethyldihydropteridine diphosphokinase